MAIHKNGIRHAVPLLVAGCAASALLGACGATATPVVRTSTPTVTSFANTDPVTGQTGQTGPTALPVAPAPSASGMPAATPQPPATVTVPNGVGLNYQQAQDAWRGAGLHVAPAVDGTGAHRLPVIDSTWVVLSQDLAAGSTVPAGSFITATVKKPTDG